MNTLREAAQQALEALETISTCYVGDHDSAGECASCHESSYLPHAPDCKKQNAITALRAALAQQEQEAVVWGVDWGSHGDRSCCAIIKQHTDGTREVVAVEYAPSYAHPPRREWRSLSEEEIDDLSRTMVKGNKSVNWLTLAILAALKEKNHG